MLMAGFAISAQALLRCMSDGRIWTVRSKVRLVALYLVNHFSKVGNFKLRAGLVFVIGFITTAVFANDPGGGTNGVGANVTLTDNGSSVTLANGVVTATIDKGSGKITSMIYGGRQVVQSGGNIHYSMDSDDGFRDMS